MINLIETKAASMVLDSIKNIYRKEILNLINDFPGITVKELYKGLCWKQSVVSHHLVCLRRSGLVRSERAGKSIHYYAHLENINVMRLLVQQLATYFKGVDSRKLQSVA